MTAEALLDAIGLLDDDLIQDAEQLSARRAVPWRQWGTWAACAVLVITLGCWAAHRGLDGGASLSASLPSASSDLYAPSQTTSAADSSAAEASSSDSNSSSAPSSADSADAVPDGLIYVDAAVYALTGDILDGLPENCRSLGVLSALYPDCPSPAAAAEEYVGCELWTPDASSPPETVYIQLPGGGFAAAVLAQP